MDCPSCQHTDTRVIDSREAVDSIRRRRECQACSFRFTTFERVEFRLPDVVKKSGQRQHFNRDKLLAGLRLACRKRPVSEEQLDAAVSRVERELARRTGEVSTREVGDLALAELRQIDDVAYLRFASVYHEITTPADFLEVLRPLLDRGTGAA
jgi:transcriptional repressor NrdR